MGKYQPHELAKLFPRMSEDEFAGLVTSIKANGLRSPISLYQGQILDGFSRDEACAKAGVEPRYIEYDGDDPIGFVTDLNLNRRNLTNGQRALAGAKLASLRHGGDRTKSSGDDLKNDNENKTRVTRKQAARKMKTSPASIDRAKQVLAANNSELLAAVETDLIGLEKAAKIACIGNKSEQKEALSAAMRPATAHQRKKAKAAGGAKKENEPSTKSNSKTSHAVNRLNSLAWADATVAQRTKFISTVGIKEIWAAMSATIKDEVRSMVDFELRKAAARQEAAGRDVDLTILDDLTIPQFLRRN
jgi:hypothetical protein